MSESEEDSELVLDENTQTEPLAPIKVENRLPNYVDDRDEVPDNLVDDEHVAKINDFWVMRAGIKCPECGSNVFLHPKSIIPHNSVDCFNCPYSPFQLVWWETPRLSSFGGGEG